METIAVISESTSNKKKEDIESTKEYDTISLGLHIKNGILEVFLREPFRYKKLFRKICRIAQNFSVLA